MQDVGLAKPKARPEGKIDWCDSEIIFVYT
jgi:hypothetical protein